MVAGVSPDILESFAKNLSRFVRLFSKEANLEGFWRNGIPRSSYFSTRQLFVNEGEERPRIPEYVIEDSFVVLDHFGETPNLSADDWRQLNFILSRRCSLFTLVITPAPRSLWSKAFDESIASKLKDHAMVIDLPTVS